MQQFIETTRNNIIKPIQTVSGVVERKQPLPILANILIKKKGNIVSFIGTDLDIQICTESPIGIDDGDFSTTVSARKINDILSTLKDEDNITIGSKGDHLTLKSGKSKFELQTLPADDFPSMNQSEFTHGFSMPCQKFRYMLSMVYFAAAQNNIRFFLNGVLISAENQTIKAVATDGHRLALCQIDQSETVSKKFDAIIPRKTVKELMRLIPDSEEMLSFDISSNQIKVMFNGIEIISKLIEGRFPDYERVIPSTNDKIFLVNRDELSLALQRVAILTTDKFKGVRWTLSSGKLIIAATNAEMEEAEDEIEIQYSGENLEIGFNVSYLLDVLNVLKNNEVRFSLGGPLSSALITMPDSENFKFVVMPMSI